MTPGPTDRVGRGGVRNLLTLSETNWYREDSEPPLWDTFPKSISVSAF